MKTPNFKLPKDKVPKKKRIKTPKTLKKDAKWSLLFKRSRKIVDQKASSGENSISPKTQMNIPLKHSIKTKFTISFISFALVPFIILCVLYTMVAQKALSDTSTTLNQEIVRQISNNINTQIKNTEEQLTKFAVTDLVSNGYLNALHSKERSKQVSAILNISKVMTSFQSSQVNINDICLVSDGCDKAVGSISPYTTDVLEEFAAKQDLIAFNWAIIDPTSTTSSVVMKSFKDVSSQTDYRVYCKVDLSHMTEYIASAKLLQDAHVYLVDQNNTTLFTTSTDGTPIEESLLSHLNSEEESSSFRLSQELISYSQLKNGWHVIVVTPINSLSSRLNHALILVVIFLIITIVLACILGSRFGKRLSAPIIELGLLMKKAEEGDLTVISSNVKSKDEIGLLCKSFNHMITNMKQLINETQDVVTHALDSSNVLYSSTTQSVETFKELAVAVSEIAEGTTSQALDSHKSTEGMATLASSMEDVTKQTTVLLEHTDGAKQIIDHATSTIHSLTETMNSSLDMVSHISQSVTELSVLNHNIEDIMQLVDNISEQTNLLALNASIEAARAGDVGKGFAVVANEVRKLADQSKSSTLSVRQTLATIAEKMQETVELAHKSQTIVKDQGSVVEDTHELFYQVIQILTNMGNELHTINDSINGMQTLKDNMVIQIDNIASVTEESAASTEEVSSLAIEQQNVIGHLSTLSKDLTSRMENLSTTIQTFKVE